MQLSNRVKRLGWMKVMQITIQEWDYELIIFPVRWGKTSYLFHSEKKTDKKDYYYHCDSSIAEKYIVLHTHLKKQPDVWFHCALWSNCIAQLYFRS